METGEERFWMCWKMGDKSQKRKLVKRNKMRHDYSEIIKVKDDVIRVLTEEKDFFRNKLCNHVEFRKPKYVHGVG